MHSRVFLNSYVSVTAAAFKTEENKQFLSLPVFENKIFLTDIYNVLPGIAWTY